MKLLLRCALASLIFCAVIVLVSVLTFNGLLAMLCWPGIVIVDAVCARLGFYESGSASVLPWMVPGLLLDFVMYTLLFWALSMAWRIFGKLRRSRDRTTKLN